MRARTLCHKPGCANVKPCAEHTSPSSGWAHVSAQRPPSHKRYPSNWASLRRLVLSQERGCRVCGSSEQAAVDHIDNTLPEPMRSSRENLQRLCRKHNTSKSAREAIKARATKRLAQESKR